MCKYKNIIGIFFSVIFFVNIINAEMLQTSIAIGVNSPKRVDQKRLGEVNITTYNITPYGSLNNANAATDNHYKGSLNINESPFIYSEAYYDRETGFNYMKARYQNPKLMRFISQDNQDLINRYSYGNSDPINNFDPTGHNAVLDIFLSFIPGFGTFNAFSKDLKWYDKIFSILSDLLCFAAPAVGAIKVKKSQMELFGECFIQKKKEIPEEIFTKEQFEGDKDRRRLIDAEKQNIDDSNLMHRILLTQNSSTSNTLPFMYATDQVYGEYITFSVEETSLKKSYTKIIVSKLDEENSKTVELFTFKLCPEFQGIRNGNDMEGNIIASVKEINISKENTDCANVYIENLKHLEKIGALNTQATIKDI